jgi:flagellar biogenesis protein FliO
MKIETIRDSTAEAGRSREIVWRAWRMICRQCRQMLCRMQKPARRLRLAESLPLGDRRFVAVVEFDEQRFLVGGTSGSLVLLATLGGGVDMPASITRDPIGDLTTAFKKTERAELAEGHH